MCRWPRLPPELGRRRLRNRSTPRVMSDREKLLAVFTTKATIAAALLEGPRSWARAAYMIERHAFHIGRRRLRGRVDGDYVSNARPRAPGGWRNSRRSSTKPGNSAVRRDLRQFRLDRGAPRRNLRRPATPRFAAASQTVRHAPTIWSSSTSNSTGGLRTSLQA